MNWRIFVPDIMFDHTYDNNIFNETYTNNMDGFPNETDQRFAATGKLICGFIDIGFI